MHILIFISCLDIVIQPDCVTLEHLITEKFAAITARLEPPAPLETSGGMVWEALPTRTWTENREQDRQPELQLFQLARGSTQSYIKGQMSPVS